MTPSLVVPRLSARRDQPAEHVQEHQRRVEAPTLSLGGSQAWTKSCRGQSSILAVTRLVLALLLASPVRGAAEASPRQVTAAFHVHSMLSTGDLSLTDVVKEAQRLEIDALILTENLRLRFEYGVLPLRGVLKKVVEYRSLRQTGWEEYLRAITEAQARFPRVVLIPGVEVSPYYYWTGSPFTHDLTMWDGEKKLHVVGLSRPDDYDRLPVVGTGWTPFYGPTLVRLLLGITAIGGAFQVLRIRRKRSVQLRHFRVTVEQRYRVWGWAALGMGVLLLLDAASLSARNPYQGNLGIAPYQDLIDVVERSGGMTFWSFPEARDFGQETIGRWGTVIHRTDPYPEVLLQTHDYTGFGALYPDTVTVPEPGRQWDQLLGEYAAGHRARPAWGIGEVGYHGAPKRLNEALTVFLVPERTPAAILAALKEGRFYALKPARDYQLVLEEFSITQDERHPGVTMGGELATSGAGPLRVTLRIGTSDGREAPVRVRLIRSGRVVEVLERTTPVEQTFSVEPPTAGQREFFRVDVGTPPALLSNPIFVTRRAGPPAP